MGEGPLGRLAGLTQSFVQFEEREITGVGGLQDRGLIDSGCLALDGSHGPLLFELLTGTVPLRILPSDDPHRWGGALPRPPGAVVETRHSRLHFDCCLRLGRQSAATKVEERGMGARMAAAFTQDGAIGMLLVARAAPAREGARRRGLPSKPPTGPREVRATERWRCRSAGDPGERLATLPDGRFRSFQTRRAGLDVFLSPTTSAARKVRGVDLTSTPWTCSRSSISRDEMQLDRFALGGGDGGGIGGGGDVSARE